MKPITVVLDKGKETKGTYRFDSPDPNAPITSVYVRKTAFEGGAVPERIVLTAASADSAQ
ncbi:MAG TPA: hypothetical protein VKV28_08280 [Candidatus Binataceae bacterium]|nr:hypothetical protein [Candidatus Binataceae bacterium]